MICWWYKSDQSFMLLQSISYIKQLQCATNSNNIHSELNDIFVWLCVNRLALNVKKTKYMIFHYRQRDIRNIIPSLIINNEPVERVTEFNFLGLTIDETLSWHPHVRKISNKISRILGMIGRLKKFLPMNIWRCTTLWFFPIYNSAFWPGVSIWADWKSYKNALCTS